MTRGISLPTFVAIGWAILVLSWGQGKICPASVARWPCPKVTKMGTKKVSHTHRLTTWFEEISFSGFPGKLKSVDRVAAVAEMVAVAAAETDQKQ